MKTTVDIGDELLARAKRHAADTGRPLRAVIEEGLRLALQAPLAGEYQLEDMSVGNSDAEDPLERYSWPQLRELIYGGDAS